MSEWIDVEDRLPEKTNGYLVAKKVAREHGTFATYVHLTGKWMVSVSGILWEIKGVQFWRESVRMPMNKLDETEAHDER